MTDGELTRSVRRDQDFHHASHLHGGAYLTGTPLIGATGGREDAKLNASIRCSRRQTGNIMRPSHCFGIFFTRARVCAEGLKASCCSKPQLLEKNFPPLLFDRAAFRVKRELHGWNPI
jgi:hypothetical protein